MRALRHSHSPSVEQRVFAMSTDRTLRSRRSFLLNVLAAGACVACGERPAMGAVSPGPAPPGPVTIENFSAAGKSQGLVKVERVIKTDAEWRATVVARVIWGDTAGGHRAAVLRRARWRIAVGTLSLHLLRHRAVRLEDQVRLRHRLAELLAGHLEAQRRRRRGPAFRHARAGDQLRALRRASRPCIQRRPATDRPAVLHEFGGTPLHSTRDLRCEHSRFIVLTLQLSCSDTALAAPPKSADDADGRAGRRMLLGRRGCLRAHARRAQRDVRLCGWRREHRNLREDRTGRTGHAESVEIKFDPKEVSYGDILRVFFSVAHDPTQLEPPGSRYRHAVSFGYFLR